MQTSLTTSHLVSSHSFEAMNGEQWTLVIDELAEFEKCPVEVQVFSKVLNRFKGIWEKSTQTRKEKPKKVTM